MGLNNSGSGDWISAIASSAQSCSKQASVRDFATPNQTLRSRCFKFYLNIIKIPRQCRGILMAPGTGFEPATNWLTANCSTTELPRNIHVLPVDYNL